MQYYKELSTDELVREIKDSLRNAPGPTRRSRGLMSPASLPVRPSSASIDTANSDEQRERDRKERSARSLQTCHRYNLYEKPRHPKPRPSRAYVPELSAMVENDQNLTDGARRLARKLAEIIYRQNRAGRYTEITVSYLMRAIARSRRTIQRYLRLLEREGYIHTEVIRGDRSRLCTGLLVSLCRPLFAAHHRANWPCKLRNSPGIPGASKKSQNYNSIDNRRGSERLSVRQWSLLCMDGVFRAFMKTDPLGITNQLMEKPTP